MAVQAAWRSCLDGDVSTGKMTGMRNIFGTNCGTCSSLVAGHVYEADAGKPRSMLNGEPALSLVRVLYGRVGCHGIMG